MSKLSHLLSLTTPHLGGHIKSHLTKVVVFLPLNRTPSLQFQSSLTQMTVANILPLPGQNFSGEKLQIARESAQLSRGELAELADTSPSFISACEKGRKKPSHELEVVLAHVLRVLPAFFYGPIGAQWELNACHFRHRQAATERLKGQFRSQLFLFNELFRVLRKIAKFPECTLPSLSLLPETPIEAVAGNLRQQWGISAHTPISRICRLLENAGVFIGYHSLKTESIDACSRRADFPVILATKVGRGAARLHYDIGHELGELIFAETASSSAIYERLINGFVGTLFMPAVGFGPHFTSKALTFSHLWELKRTWRVSASAILQRALKLDLIKYDLFVLWKRKLIARGFGRVEPEEPIFAEPENLRRALTVASQAGITPADIAHEIGIETEVLLGMIHPHLAVPITGEPEFHRANDRAINFAEAQLASERLD